MIETIPAPIILVDMPNHLDNKDKILKAIDQMPDLSITDNDDQITKSDWNLDHNIRRDYWDILTSSINILIEKEIKKLDLVYGIRVSNWWYQQYYNTDTHAWHRHEGATYSCVYYVELPKDAPSTLLRNPLDIDQIFTTKAVEGQVLIFPAIFSHCSPPNQSQQRKTIVAFNIV